MRTKEKCEEDEVGGEGKSEEGSSRGEKKRREGRKFRERKRRVRKMKWVKANKEDEDEGEA